MNKWKNIMTDKQTCKGLDCAWCVTFNCPKENERLKARVKELEKANKLFENQLIIALTSLVFIRDIAKDLYSIRRVDQILQKIRQMEQEAKEYKESGNNDR